MSYIISKFINYFYIDQEKIMMEQKSNAIFFANKSKKLLSKIAFVNALTPKEISTLNSRYMKLGLHIKQVVVDSYGNEKNKKESSLLSKKRKRKQYNSLNKFLYNYYGKEELPSTTKKFKTYNKKYLSDKENNNNYSKEDLSELSQALNSIKKDLKTIEYKNCTIETDEFKLIIVDYISKFKKYISKEQYSFLIKKWKIELSTIKGIDFLDFNKFDDFMNWKVSILKSLKSEITLYALCNICENIINEKKIINENKNIEKNINNEKIQQNEQKKESSDSESSDVDDDIEDNNIDRNEALLLQFIKNANNDEE